MERRKLYHKTHSLKAREAMLHELIKDIEVPIENLDLLDRAFTHSSYANEHKLDYTAHNERLEFLGDAVLDLIIGEYLFLTYPEMTEGELTRLKASTVCESTLADCSGKLNLGKYLLLGKGELCSGGRQRVSMLADTFEALLGAIYLDKSYEEAKQFALSHLSGYLELAKSGQLGKDFKTLLQELVQLKGETTISYHMIKAIGPDHNKVFFMEVIIDGVPSGIGEGRSKKEAEQQAAKQAYEQRVKG